VSESEIWTGELAIRADEEGFRESEDSLEANGEGLEVYGSER
jgi:hypothetical protein